MVDQLAQSQSLALAKEVIQMKQALHKLNDLGFTQVPNEVLDDQKLKLSDKGLFSILWRQADDWQFYESELIKRSDDGRDAFRKSKNRLIEHGYLMIEQTRDKNGRMSTAKWYLNPYPNKKIVKSLEKTQDDGVPTVDGFSVDGKPADGETADGKPDTNNTNCNKTNCNKTNSKKRVTSELPSSSDTPRAKDKKKVKYEPDSKPYRCARKLLDEILKNKPDFKIPNLQKWADTFRLMNERDERSWKTIGDVIMFATQDDFWRVNILSADKLRKQFDRLEMEKDKQRQNRKVVQRETLPDWAKNKDGSSNQSDLKKLSTDEQKRLDSEIDRLMAELEATDPDKRRPIR